MPPAAVFYRADTEGVLHHKQRLFILDCLSLLLDFTLVITVYFLNGSFKLFYLEIGFQSVSELL